MSQQTTLAEQVQVRTLQGFKAGKLSHYRHSTSQLTAAKHTPWAVAVITSSLADRIERQKHSASVPAMNRSVVQMLIAKSIKIQSHKYKTSSLAEHNNMQLKNQFGKISQPLMIGLLLLITFLIAVGIWFSSKIKPLMNMRMP